MGEVSLCKELSKIIGGRTEVITPVGRIDLLNDQIIIEAKISKYFKQSIGQLLCYKLYYKRPHQGIAIIGKLPRYSAEVCQKLDLWLFNYSYNNYQWDLIIPRK